MKNLRKCKILIITPSSIIAMMRTGTSFRTIEGLPKDAKFVRCKYNMAADRIEVLVFSNKFKEIPEGGLFPITTPTFRNLYLNKDKLRDLK